MKTIAILSQKGGAGKTTLAVNLAVVANNATKGRAAVIDLDPQASATSWGDSREAETPVVVSAQASRLPQVLKAAEENAAKVVILDTAPHSESAALAAARAADFVLIPCRPAILDLRAINSTIDLVRLAGVKAAVVLNCIPPRGALAEEAAEAISGYNIPMAPTRIGQRAVFQHSLTVGQGAAEYEPDGKGAEEIKALYLWMCKQVGKI